jgi:hypothetical protein
MGIDPSPFCLAESGHDYKWRKAKGGFLTMGTKRVGLARTQALIQNLARSLSLGTTTIACQSVTTTGDVTGANIEGTSSTKGATLQSTGEFIVGVQSVAAAGSNQGDATEISAGGGTLVTVTGAGSNKGVKLPALSGITAGTQFVIVNTASATLKVYPGTGDKILPASDNGAVEAAANAGLILWKADDDSWYGFEPAVIVAD